MNNVDAYKQQKTKSQIKKLEKAREKCGKWIRKLENEEMSLDDLDDEDSNYMKLDRYKRRYMVLRKKIHELQKQKMSLGRRCDKKFKTEGTVNSLMFDLIYVKTNFILFLASRLPDVNERICEMVNQGKKFPDFVDILKIYKAVTAKKGLSYSDSELKEQGNLQKKKNFFKKNDALFSRKNNR